MTFKFSSRLSIVWSLLALAGGCSQVLGLGDYEIDPSLGGAGAPSDVGEGGGTPRGGSASKAGTSSTQAGEPGANGGDPGIGQGGSGGQMSGQAGQGDGGQPVIVGAAGAAGAAGEGGAGGAAPSTLVPCDSAECCTTKGGKAVGVELLKDGSFEIGTPDDGSPWSEVTTTAGNELIFNDLSLGFKPKAGNYFVYLSGIASEDSTVYQYVVVPKDAGWMVVSGYRLFQIDSQDDVNLDFSAISLYSYPAGDLVEAPFYWGRPSDSSDGWGATSTWKFFQASWDATPHQGLKRDIEFRGSSDDYSTDPSLTSSSYLFDELSLKVFRCYK